MPRNLTLFQMTYLIHSGFLSRVLSTGACLWGWPLSKHTHTQTKAQLYVHTLKQTRRASKHTHKHIQTNTHKVIHTHTHLQTLDHIALLQWVIYYTELNTHWHLMLLAIPLTWSEIIDSLQQLRLRSRRAILLMQRRSYARSPSPTDSLQGPGWIDLFPPHPYHSLN